jgi:putative SOS response-associated peptidase YedK
MCGRYTLHADKEALSKQFGLDFGEVTPRYNLAPTERIRFVFSNADEAKQAGFARWGLVPHWSKTGATDKPLLNARSETVLQKPAFRDAFARGRYLIPTSGWYEWSRTELGGKQPYYLRPKEGGVLAFAGLFDVWRAEGEKPVVSCTILTTQASDGVSWLHERMPVVLDYDHYDMWLDRTTPDIADLTELLTPYPAQELEVYPVSTVVNRANAEGAGLLEPLEGARS